MVRTWLLVMAGRGVGDGGHSPVNSDVRSPSSSAAGAMDWPMLDADQQQDLDELTDYRRRCMLLEASLVKFKEKATRVRQLFTVKVWFLSLYCTYFYRLTLRQVFSTLSHIPQCAVAAFN